MCPEKSIPYIFPNRRVSSFENSLLLMPLFVEKVEHVIAAGKLESRRMEDVNGVDLKLSTAH